MAKTDSIPVVQKKNGKQLFEDLDDEDWKKIYKLNFFVLWIWVQSYNGFNTESIIISLVPVVFCIKSNVEMIPFALFARLGNMKQ